MIKKGRADKILFELGLVTSRTKAVDLIKAKKVLWRGQPVDKGSQTIDEEGIELLDHDAFVGRGAYKLKGALDYFSIDLRDKILIDVGASTGGFTDLALRQGASKVYAVDVGTNQLAEPLKKNTKVINLEGADIRHLKLTDFAEQPQLAVVDVSFISVRLILESVANLLPAEGEILCLIKPQFEVGSEKIGKNGIVKNIRYHRELLYSFKDWVETKGWGLLGFSQCALPGKGGNQEYFMYLKKNAQTQKNQLFSEIEKLFGEEVE